MKQVILCFSSKRKPASGLTSVQVKKDFISLQNLRRYLRTLLFSQSPVHEQRIGEVFLSTTHSWSRKQFFDLVHSVRRLYRSWNGQTYKHRSVFAWLGKRELPECKAYIAFTQLYDTSWYQHIKAIAKTLIRHQQDRTRASIYSRALFVTEIAPLAYSRPPLL